MELPLSETQTPESPLTTFPSSSQPGGLVNADYSPNQDYSPSNNDNPSNSSPKAPRSDKTSSSPNRSIKVQAMGELGTEEIVKNPTEKIGEIDSYINGLLEKLKVERQRISEMEAARISIKNLVATSQKEQENVEPVAEKRESAVEVTTKSSSSSSPTNNTRNERVSIRESSGRAAVDKAKKIAITSLEPFKSSKLSLNEIISISTQRMNFGVGMPGKIVEESLDITNKTNEDIVVQIFVDCLNPDFKDSEEYIYSIRRSHLYDYNDKHYLIMSPYSAASFRITLKVPNIKHECDILGDVKIGVRGVKGVNKISLSSRVIVPRVICPKELFNTDIKCNIIKLAIKQGKKAESKFPLKNLSNVPVSLDLNFFTPKNVEEDPQFQCLLHPSVVNIPPGGMAFVNITLKSLKTLGRMPVDQENKSFKKEHLLRFDCLEGLQHIKKLVLQNNKSCIIVSEKGDLWKIDLKELFSIVNKKKLLHFFETNSTFPIKKELSNLSIVELACNQNITLAITSHGAVFSWGKDPYQSGILGLGDGVTYVYNPTKIPNLVGITQVSLSENHAAAINNQGSLFTWGSGPYGELGHQNLMAVAEPVIVRWPQVLSIQKAICYKNMTCVLTIGGNIQVYGTMNPREYKGEKIITGPRNIEGLTGAFIVNMNIGDNFVVMLTERGDLYLISENLVCQKIEFPVGFQDVASKNDKIYAITEEGNYLVEWTYHKDLASVLDPQKTNAKISQAKVLEIAEEYHKGLSFQACQYFGGTILLFDSIIKREESANNIANRFMGPKEGSMRLQVIKSIGKKDGKFVNNLSHNLFASQIFYSKENMPNNFGKNEPIKDKFFGLNFDSDSLLECRPLARTLQPKELKKEMLSFMEFESLKHSVSQFSHERKRKEVLGALEKLRSPQGKENQNRKQYDNKRRLEKLRDQLVGKSNNKPQKSSSNLMDTIKTMRGKDEEGIISSSRGETRLRKAPFQDYYELPKEKEVVERESPETRKLTTTEPFETQEGGSTNKKNLGRFETLGTLSSETEEIRERSFMQQGPIHIDEFNHEEEPEEEKAPENLRTKEKMAYSIVMTRDQPPIIITEATRRSALGDISNIEGEKSVIPSYINFGEYGGEEEFELGQTRTYSKGRHDVDVSKLTLKDRTMGNHQRVEEEFVDYEEIKKKGTSNMINVTELLKKSMMRDESKLKTWEEEDQSDQVSRKFNETVRMRDGQMQSGIIEEMEKSTERNPDMDKQRLEEAIHKAREEFILQENIRLMRERGCIIMREILKRKNLAHIYKSFLAIHTYSLENQGDNDVEKLERMMEILQEQEFRWSCEGAQEAFMRIKDLPIEEEGNFVDQISVIMRFKDIISRQLCGVYKDFFLGLYSYNVQKISHKGRMDKVVRLATVILHKVQQNKFQAFHMIQLASFALRNKQENHKEAAKRLAHKIAHILAHRGLRWGLASLKTFSMNARFLQRCLIMLEGKLTNVNQRQKREFLTRLKLRSEIHKIKYPQFAINFSQKMHICMQKTLMGAFSAIRQFSNENKVQKSHLLMSHANFLNILLSRFTEKTKREAFMRILNMSTSINQQEKTRAIMKGFGVILSNLYGASLKQSLYRIKEHGYIKTNWLKHQQIQKTVLKHFLRTLNMKLQGHFRDFINAVEIKEKLENNDKQARQIQVNYQLTLFAQKLQQILTKRKTEVIQIFKELQVASNKKQSRGFALYVQALLFDKIRLDNMKFAFFAIKDYSPVTVSVMSSATKKKVLGDIDPNQPRLLESASKNTGSSPNFKAMEEKTPGGSHRKRRQLSRDKENEFSTLITSPGPEGNQSFGELSKRSNKTTGGLRSKETSGSKTPKQDILAMKMGTFGEEIEEEKERMSPPGASQTLSLGTNSPDLYKILEDSENKIRIFNESSQRNPSRFSMSGVNLKMGSLLDSSPSSKQMELRRASFSPTKKKMSGAKDSSKPKVSYLLRNYDIGFRVGDNQNNQENNPNKAEYLVAEHGSEYKFYSLIDRKQLNNPNESMEIFKHNNTENQSELEEYAEPLELEQKLTTTESSKTNPTENFEGFGLSSVDSYGPGTAQTLSLADTLTPKNLMDLFSPTSMQSPQNLAPNQKDYVYTKFFPKPSHLKENVPVKPKSCLKKPSERGFGAEPRKKSRHNVIIKEDKIHNTSASQTNISGTMTTKSNQPATLRGKNPADLKSGTSSRSTSPILNPDMLNSQTQNKYFKSNKNQQKEQKKRPQGPQEIRYKRPPSNEALRNLENDSMHLSVQDLHSGHKQKENNNHKNFGKKDLQIQIPVTSEEKQGLSSNIMSQIEQRLLEEEKYGTLYGMYKDKNPEKANAVLGLYRGTLSAKSSSMARNISPTAATGGPLSSSRQELHGSGNTFKSASPTMNRLDMKRGGQGYSERSHLEKSNSSKELLRSGKDGFKSMKFL